MKVNKMRDNFTPLEIKQREVIDELQEKIKLLEFDKSKNLGIIRDLKMSISNKKNSIYEVIKELEKIQSEANYSRLKYIIRILKIITRDGDEDE